MQVLLSTLNAKYIHINLAIRLLYHLNKDRGGISYKEFTIKEDPESIADRCKAMNLVAFSCYIWNITQTLEVAKRIKEKNPACKIMLGGPEVSYEFEEIIRLPYIDFIIQGEGEIAFSAFLDHPNEPEQVPSLIYKVGTEIRQNKVAPQFDLKNFENSNPYESDPVEDLHNKVLYVETSRGCPYKCEFCLASLDNKVRYLPIPTLKNNLLYLMQHGRVVKFLDRTFNIKKDFTIDMFQFILDHHRPGNVFQFEITADIVHPDIIRFINEKVPKGLFRFEIGIQTVNQKANLEVSRKQNFEKTKGIIQQLDQKIEMHLDLIVGLPLDRWEDIKYSFEEVFKLYAPELQLGFLKFLKGTPVREKYEQHGFKFDPLPPYQIIESNYLSKEELHRITELEHALEIYWNGKKACNTLRYVNQQGSIFDFLAGLGHAFGQKHDFHKYALVDIFQVLSEFAAIFFPGDTVLQELIAVDYYLHFKVKPQTLFLEEVALDEKKQHIRDLQLDPHRYRYIILPTSFDVAGFLEKGIVVPSEQPCILRYDGVNKASILDNKREFVSLIS